MAAGKPASMGVEAKVDHLEQLLRAKVRIATCPTRDREGRGALHVLDGCRSMHGAHHA